MSRSGKTDEDMHAAAGRILAINSTADELRETQMLFLDKDDHVPEFLANNNLSRYNHWVATYVQVPRLLINYRIELGRCHLEDKTQDQAENGISVFAQISRHLSYVIEKDLTENAHAHSFHLALRPKFIVYAHAENETQPLLLLVTKEEMSMSGLSWLHFRCYVPRESIRWSLLQILVQLF